MSQNYEIYRKRSGSSLARDKKWQKKKRAALGGSWYKNKGLDTRQVNKNTKIRQAGACPLQNPRLFDYLLFPPPTQMPGYFTRNPSFSRPRCTPRQQLSYCTVRYMTNTVLWTASSSCAGGHSTPSNYLGNGVLTSVGRLLRFERAARCGRDTSHVLNA